MSLCNRCVHCAVCGTDEAREKIGKASPFLYTCDDFIDKSVLSVPKRENGYRYMFDKYDDVWGDIVLPNCGTDE